MGDKISAREPLLKLNIIFYPSFYMENFKQRIARQLDEDICRKHLPSFQIKLLHAGAMLEKLVPKVIISFRNLELSPGNLFKLRHWTALPVEHSVYDVTRKAVQSKTT
jgi:hypothetical protein